MSAYLPSISVARGSFTDEVERNIMKYFSNGSFMSKTLEVFENTLEWFPQTVYETNLSKPFANSNNKRSIRLTFRIFPLSSLPGKVIKVTISFDRNSLISINFNILKDINF